MFNSFASSLTLSSIAWLLSWRITSFEWIAQRIKVSIHDCEFNPWPETQGEQQLSSTEKEQDIVFLNMVSVDWELCILIDEILQSGEISANLCLKLSRLESWRRQNGRNFDQNNKMREPSCHIYCKYNGFIKKTDIEMLYQSIKKLLEEHLITTSLEFQELLKAKAV